MVNIQKEMDIHRRTSKTLKFLYNYVQYLLAVEETSQERFGDLLPQVISCTKNRLNSECKDFRLDQILTTEEYARLLYVCQDNQILKAVFSDELKYDNRTDNGKGQNISQPISGSCYSHIILGIFVTLRFHVLELIFCEQEFSSLSPILKIYGADNPLINRSYKKNSTKIIKYLYRIIKFFGYRVSGNFK